MIVLDAYAVLAYLRDEGAVGEVGELLAEPTVLIAVNAAEVFDQLVRVYGCDADIHMSRADDDAERLRTMRTKREWRA